MDQEEIDRLVEERGEAINALALAGFNGEEPAQLLNAVRKSIAASRPAGVRCSFTTPSDGEPAVRDVLLPGSSVWLPTCEKHLSIVDCNFPDAKTRKIKGA